MTTDIDGKMDDADKFVTPCELPSAHDSELLTILMEEAFEVLTFLGPRASKAKRFGLDEIQPGQPFTNSQRLAHEAGDLIAVVERLVSCGAISKPALDAAIYRKHVKLRVFMQTPITDLSGVAEGETR